MPKLNQVVAARTHKNSTLMKAFIGLANRFQKVDLFVGNTGRYEPINDDGLQKPDEFKPVQYTVPQVLEQAHTAMADMIDLELTNACGNAVAMADIVVDGVILAQQVPVTGLMALEKLLKEERQMIERIPVNSTQMRWEYNQDNEYWVTPETETFSHEKVHDVIVKYAATEFHPAQTDLVTTSKPVGRWFRSVQSGAISPSAKAAMLKRCDDLLVAVKSAREEANTVEVDNVTVGMGLLNWVTGDAR
jgi:hypothetical protein